MESIYNDHTACGGRGGGVCGCAPEQSSQPDDGPASWAGAAQAQAAAVADRGGRGAYPGAGPATTSLPSLVVEVSSLPVGIQRTHIRAHAVAASPCMTCPRRPRACAARSSSGQLSQRACDERLVVCDVDQRVVLLVECPPHREAAKHHRLRRPEDFLSCVARIGFRSGSGGQAAIFRLGRTSYSCK